MTSIQRVRCALDCRVPDRVPIDLNICLEAYDALKAHLGLGLEDHPSPNSAMEVIPHPEVLAHLGVDLISVKLGGVSESRGELPAEVTDAWGVTRRLIRQQKGSYYEVVCHPLAGAALGDLEGYPWPDPRPIAKAEALHAHAENLFEETDLALVGRFGGPILELAADLLGMEEWYVRLATDRDFIAALLGRIGAVCTAHDLMGIDAAGPYLSIMKVSGEDFGGQNGPLYSPALFREVLLPPLERRWRAVRAKLEDMNLACRIMLHSCGSMRAFIPDLLETGCIDILDPAQPLAAGMVPAELRDEFGDRLVFHGGIDVQKLLPFGIPEDVTEATRSCLSAFRADEGGFIAAPSHTVQADVPPENIVAMVQAVHGWQGRGKKG